VGICREEFRYVFASAVVSSIVISVFSSMFSSMFSSATLHRQANGNIAEKLLMFDFVGPNWVQKQLESLTDCTG
jgi:hypothetical protein